MPNGTIDINTLRQNIFLFGQLLNISKQMSTDLDYKRNEFIELKNHNLTEQEKVEKLLNDNDISLEEIRYISSKLETKVNEIEDLTKITANTISEVTHYTTVSIGPKAISQLIEEIKFVLLGQRMMMAVILTDTGLVKETIIKFDEDINEKQVETMNYMFNNKLKGQPIEKIWADTERDNWMTAQEALEYGLIDSIVENRPKKEENK